MASRFLHGRVAQYLHGASAILVPIAFILGPGGTERRVYSAAVDADRQFHETLGLCVLALLVMRVLWRLVHARPVKVVHGLLYALLFAVPMTAIAGAWLEGHPLTLIGGVQIAPLWLPSHDLGTKVAVIHKWLGDALMWLAGAHALAGLYRRHRHRL